jgi:glycosyltransferase involved in cell wall biosynthesis
VDKHCIGIVIPAFNEAKTIGQVVKDAAHYGIPIVVDDASTDDTADVALAMGSKVVIHPINRGYDAALNSGFQRALEMGMQMVITLDADGQHDPSLIREFINGIESGFDVVLGVRGRHQRLAESLFALYTRVRYGLNDPLCGMKAYKSFLYQKLGHFDSYGSIGTELMLYAVKNGHQYAQIPIAVHDRIDSPRFGKIFAANYKIIRAMFLSM